MAELMTREAFNQLQKKLESNELYLKSKSLHKGFQYRLFSNPAEAQLRVMRQRILLRRREKARRGEAALIFAAAGKILTALQKFIVFHLFCPLSATLF